MHAGFFFKKLAHKARMDTHTHTDRSDAISPYCIMLHEGIIKTSIDIDWPNIFTGKNTKITKMIYGLRICMNHGAKIYRYENKKNKF